MAEFDLDSYAVITTGLTKRFGEVGAVRGVDLTIEDGKPSIVLKRVEGVEQSLGLPHVYALAVLRVGRISSIQPRISRISSTVVSPMCAMRKVFSLSGP